MASLFDFFGCFSEASPNGKSVCNGDVCVLRKDSRCGGSVNLKKKQRSLKFPFVGQTSQKANSS